ncbi:hypothetical protein AALO_G00171880, partial [Alosa alosa]
NVRGSVLRSFLRDTSGNTLRNINNFAYYCIEEDAGNNRLVEHPEELTAHIEGPQPPPEVQPALPFLVECISVG